MKAGLQILMRKPACLLIAAVLLVVLAPASMAALGQPAGMTPPKVNAIALNTFGLSDAEAEAAIQATEQTTGIPLSLIHI